MNEYFRGDHQGSRPLRVFSALAALGAGAALILAPLSTRETAIVTGIGLVFSGLAVILHDVDPAAARGSVRLRRAFGIVIVVFGAIVALVPAVGAPWVAFLIGAALIFHGVLAIVRAVRNTAHSRSAEIISAFASIVFGSLVFTWPVLTLTVFRLAVGAWFVFVGLRLLVEFVTGRQRRRATSQPRPHRWIRVAGASLSLGLAVCLAVASGVLLGGAKLPEPDAFYAAPADASSGPGHLIRAEPLSTGVPEGAQAWRILYTTTHPDGEAAISSGTVIAPIERGSEPLPLLSIAHGTTGVAPKCAPSLGATPFADGAGAALEEMVTEHGWAAVISDYIGLGTQGTHPYLIGDAEARNVLDASRAIQELPQLATTTETVVWGHSQGGQGSLWTGQIAEEYAPELTVRGVAAFAPAADLYGLADADKNEAAGKTVSAYIASTWDRIYPDLRLAEHLTPGSAGGVERISNLCFNGKDVLGAILSGTQIPNQVFPDSLLAGAFGSRLKAQTPTGPFPAPVLVAQGLADPLVKPAQQAAWVEGRCDAGVEIDYRTYPGLDHLSLVAADSPLTPQLVTWTLDRWSGAPATPNCADLPGTGTSEADSAEEPPAQ